MKLCFAYGSNLWNEQLKERCPGHELAGKAVLQDYQWIINSRGVATVVPSQSDYVEGVLSWLTEVDEGRLDLSEGVSKQIYRKQYLYVQFQGHPTLALVYVAADTTKGKPRDEYIGRINKGLEDAKLSAAYVQKYIRPFVPAAKS